MTGLKRCAAVSSWLLLGGAVLAHQGTAALAAAEYARLGWLFGTRFDLVAVTFVLATALIGLGVSARVAARASTGSVELRRLIRSGRRPCPAAVREAAAAVGLDGRVDVADSGEAFAVTYGLFRPRVVVGAGLAGVLSPAELSAVLAHERCHLRHRDPLRLLAARLLAGYACWLPVTGWLADRLALRLELAADADAAERCGRGALAGALLKLGDTQPCPAMAGASRRGSLEARVAQLEGGKPARPRLARAKLAASACNLAVLLAAGTCCVGLSQALPGGVL